MLQVGVKHVSRIMRAILYQLTCPGWPSNIVVVAIHNSGSTTSATVVQLSTMLQIRSLAVMDVSQWDWKAKHLCTKLWGHNKEHRVVKINPQPVTTASLVARLLLSDVKPHNYIFKYKITQKYIVAYLMYEINLPDWQ